MSLINWLNDVIFTYCHRYTPTWVLRTVSYPEVYPGPSQVSNMDLFAIKANRYKIMLPTIITKSSIVVVWRGTAYFSDCKFTIPKLRLVSAIFYQSFILHQMIALQKLWKMLFISSEKLFSFSRYSIFCIFVFPSFFPVSHCFRGWFKKNLKVHDINCLNKSFIAHVWYLEKEIRCDIETLSIDRELNKEHFYGKIMQKMCTKS